MFEDKKTLKLDDEVVSHFAKVLQYAILTGTDIVDHLRNVRLEESTTNPGYIKLNMAYVKMIEDFEAHLLEQATTIAAEAGIDVETDEHV